MFDDWVRAHEFEWVISGIALVGVALIVGVVQIFDAFCDKRRERKKLDADYQALQDTKRISDAIAEDIRKGLTSANIRDEIIRKVGMMANARTEEMQARYDAALKREGKQDSPEGPITKVDA